MVATVVPPGSFVHNYPVYSHHYLDLACSMDDHDGKRENQE